MAHYQSMFLESKPKYECSFMQVAGAPLHFFVEYHDLMFGVLGTIHGLFSQLSIEWRSYKAPAIMVTGVQIQEHLFASRMPSLHTCEICYTENNLKNRAQTTYK